MVLIAGVLLFCCPSFAAEVRVEHDGNGWSLLVDGKPYFIRGMDYRVTRVGEGPDDGSLQDWAYYDDNGNGMSDGPYDAWIDRDGDGAQDEEEPAQGDFAMMASIGVNTIRWYVNDFKRQVPDKTLLRDLYDSYGIRVAVGNKFGAYTIDSGADWSTGTDYRDPSQRRAMLDSVRRMVLAHKDEPYTLLWLLGNENNLRFTNTNADRFPKDYASLLEEAAKLIHELDGMHPVAMVNGDTRHLREYARSAPSVDIFGANVYRGADGFGGLWKEVRAMYDKPVLLAEYGGSYANGLDEDRQADYHKNCWLDIEANRSGSGEGNAIGGFAFEWLDEWWKAGEPGRQAQPGTSGHQGTGSASWTQEYCGILSQGDGRLSPFLRRPRKAYEMYRGLWGAGE